MNPLTQIRNTQKATQREVAAGYSDSASWHARFRHSAYVYAGGLPFDLTEGDVLAVFSQYGEIVDLNLVRDKETGKKRGFAFLAYEDQRSTVLAVDNLSGARVGGRTIKVDHVDNYKLKKAEVEGRAPSESPSEGEEEPLGAAGGDLQREAEADGAQVVAPAAAGSGPGSGPGAGPSRPAPGGPSDAPWGGASSIFALMEEAGAQQPPRGPPGSGAAGGGRDRSPKRQKKEKHKKEKEKHKGREREREGQEREKEKQRKADRRRER